MGELKDLKKEELLEFATRISEKFQIAQSQVSAIDGFYKDLFTTEGEKVAYSIQINTILDTIKNDLEGINKIKSEVQHFFEMTLIGAEGSESTKDKIESLVKVLESTLENYSIKAKEVSDFADTLFKSEESRVSLQEQITGFISSSEEGKNAILQNLEEVNSKLGEIKIGYDSFIKYSSEILLITDASRKNSEILKGLYDDIEKKSDSVQSQIAQMKEIFETKPEIDKKLADLGEVFKRGDDYDSKLGNLYKAITERRKEIDKLYFEIIGYIDKDEDGVETDVPGLKAELTDTYTRVKSNLLELDKQLIELRSTTESKYKQFAAEKEIAFNENLKNWNDQFLKIESTISALLPNALTAGLSYAYSEKKIAEEKENDRFSKTFYLGIWGLILVSLIPFAISLQSIYDHTALAEVILRIPRLVLAILPLYIPVLWVAYSSNRKMNLSKRLIEEYSHKEVLSKTFEGLSKQINNIEDKNTSADLRVKLLYNILEVNSENPGKLISDYNKSDHPLMDALDKSVKLTNAVTKLAKIPGFSKIATILEKKSDDILKTESEKVNTALDSIIDGEEKTNGIKK